MRGALRDQASPRHVGFGPLAGQRRQGHGGAGRAIQPFLRLQVEEAAEALQLGLQAPFKPATPTKMQALGWPLPDGLRPGVDRVQ